jgi:hypothetical protein
MVRDATHLVGQRKVAGYTLAMMCYVDGTWDGQGNDCFDWASGISMASGSDVTSYNNEDPSITPFFQLCTSSNMPSVSKEYYNLVLLPLRKEMTVHVLQVLA